MGEEGATRQLTRACARTAAVAVFLATAAAVAYAQQPISVSVRADNDAFNFWQPAWARPDEEYTSGVRGSLVYAGGAPWEAWLHRGGMTCMVGDNRCATHTLSLGQDIYTGHITPGNDSADPGSRPDAGFLYVQEASHVASRGHLDETSVTFGLTGPPSLGEVMQRTFHAIAPSLNRAIDWSRQVPFEPGVAIAYDRTERILVSGEGALLGGDFEPHAGASLGNILTEARAGLRVREGFNLRHPWLMAAESNAPQVEFFADATLHAVARNEFLAGAVFRPSDRVSERPIVPEMMAGLSLRWRRLTATYDVDRTGPEYLTRTTGHSWSRLGVEWRIER